MIEKNCLSLVQVLANNRKDLVVIFQNDKIVLSNASFNSFFGVSSTERYLHDFGPFIENFVPHPSYFNKEKIVEGESWFESIMKLEKLDRTVSMMTSSYEPRAFGVEVDDSLENFKVVAFEDVTESLIKRIMIENNASLDRRSGAYAKDYFNHVMKSYEDAAAFNEKIIGVSVIDASESDMDDKALKEFVSKFKRSVRQDDMLVKWGERKFLLAYLVENEENAKQVVEKLKRVSTYKLSSRLQREDETLLSLVGRVEKE